ncbi:MAG: hypothetical protein ACYC63_18015 [Armatimonadota bacterium]
MRLNNQISFLPLIKQKPTPKPVSMEGPHAERPYRGASGPRRGTSTADVAAHGPAKERTTASDIRTRDACQKFEGFLLGEMLKTMRGESNESKGIIPTSRGERIFIRQQCEVLGDILGRNEPLGMRRILVGETDQARPAGHDTAPLALPERGPL